MNHTQLFRDKKGENSKGKFCASLSNEERNMLSVFPWAWKNDTSEFPWRK